MDGATHDNRGSVSWWSTAVAVCALGLATVAACSGPAHPSAAAGSAGSGASLPATAPHLVMDNARDGWAVWPSAGSWLLLRTTDGWRSVSNRTPIAVPTGGGLVTAASAGQVTVAVGAYERLTRSPVLSGNGTAGDWKVGELPAAVINSRTALSVASGRTTVLRSGAGGTLARRSGQRWVDLTNADTLAGAGNLALDGVTWASAEVGWLTGHGRTGGPMAFQTRDAGHSWAPVRASSGTAVDAALAPCGGGTTWVLPLLADNATVRLLRTNDGGQHWLTGSAVTRSRGLPAWSCHGNEVWIASRVGSFDHVLASSDGGRTWTDAGPTPGGLSDLVLTGAGQGYAASTSGNRPALWSVTGNGTRFTPIPLPTWVAALGAQAPDS